MLLFDVNWLYETSRFNDFTDSLQQWSTFNYIKGIVGHCAFNRIQGGTLEAHPHQPGKNILHLRHIPDSSLVSDVRGAVWNFPAFTKGRFTTRIRIPENDGQVSLLLNDRWLNPTDTTAHLAAMFSLELSRKQLRIADDHWHTVTLEWNLNAPQPMAYLQVDGKKIILRLPLHTPSQMGISYAHFITHPANGHNGIQIESVRAEQLLR
jgi:hypothetical protein